MNIRVMTIEDYEKVYGLWRTIRGFGIRSMDDSREGISRFLKRNPTTSITAWEGDLLIGAILCGHRRQGVGKAMVIACMEALKAEEINKLSLIAFTKNDIGNAFWNRIGWTKRQDLNYYDFSLNEANITAFIEDVD